MSVPGCGSGQLGSGQLRSAVAVMAAVVAGAVVVTATATAAAVIVTSVVAAVITAVVAAVIEPGQRAGGASRGGERGVVVPAVAVARTMVTLPVLLSTSATTRPCGVASLTFHTARSCRSSDSTSITRLCGTAARAR